MVAWKDMNGDGKADIITARATKPILVGKTGGQLLWLEQPPSNPTVSVPWKEHILASGPDVDFAVADLKSGDDQFEIFAAEFFSQRLSLLTISTSSATVTNTRDIDTEIGHAYSVSLVDLNVDGSLDLLVTNHQGGSGGAVYAYEIPQDILKGNFTRHVIATGFKVLEPGANQAAPGFAYAFQVNARSTEKPHILVAGDGSQYVYLLTPKGDDFVYSCEPINFVDGVVGSVGILNVGETAKYFVPNYDGNQLFGYTFG